MLTTERRRRGRPCKPAHERLVPLTTNYDPDTYDAICRLAAARDETVSEMVRQLVKRCLRHHAPPVSVEFPH